MSKTAFEKIEAGLNALDYGRNSSLKPADFHIGMEFDANGKTYRCTDIGTRTVVAVRIDPVEITTKHSGTSSPLSKARRTLRRSRRCSAALNGLSLSADVMPTIGVFFFERAMTPDYPIGHFAHA
ncbi:hypothetical protein [Mesorhizobium sp. YR577]|uniref:hypothetical protein n=1 Tax=Mesorhizobium sp. YR577 TaxID=1884373 RepID=UPI0008EE0F6D|nr:hypothetical protein [Mesorhizobium sp. YR577]SFU22289.1 hypothetical protein SAMN05518861_13415 [Mesorhizobium sp. YR577]